MEPRSLIRESPNKIHTRIETQRGVAAGLALLLLAACGSSDEVSESAIEPGLQTAQAVLDAQLKCTPFVHPDKSPVLLVHGTFLTGNEQYALTYLPLLAERGFDVCVVTYPDRGFGDIQTSAEYIVNAVRKIHAATGRRLALVGHSQGVEEMRWAAKWWPSVRASIADLVSLAGPNHGGDLATLLTLTQDLGGVPGLVPEVIYQLRPDSHFIAALNAGDETPGDIDYTALYTQFDEIVQPVSPVPSAALDFGLGNPRVTNLLLQDLCPGRFVDHGTIGVSDRLTFDLMLDAIANPGPASIDRAGGAEMLCGDLRLIPDQAVSVPSIRALLDFLQQELEDAQTPDLHLSNAEPPLRDYAGPAN